MAADFWTPAMMAFVVAALGFWNVLVPPEWWRQAAVAGAAISLAGIVLFAGTWSLFSSL